EVRAQTLATQLDILNRERQRTEAEIVEAILARCEEDALLLHDRAALVFAGAEWHLGVLGIVASRLVERFSRPVFVLSQAAEDGLFSGSGRSIPAFHLLEALESMRELFTKFGLCTESTRKLPLPLFPTNASRSCNRSGHSDSATRHRSFIARRQTWPDPRKL